MRNAFTIEFIAIALTVFLITVLAEYKLIPLLRSYKAGQKILDIGPRWHKHKEGTPIMGGLGFILATLLVMAGYFILKAVFSDVTRYIPLALTLAFAVANGAIGFVDDYFKLIKKENEGLTPRQKILLQFVMAAAYVCVMSYTGFMHTVLAIPFTDLAIDLGWFYYPLAVILLVGVINGANFTDGVDGLASSVSLVIGIFFAIWAFAASNALLSSVGAILIGATLGFLIFNFHPAKVFMGDTGSLFLGALVIGGCFAAHNELVGLIVSAVFIVEMLSSLLQRLWFKLTRKLYGEGRRLFRMAPLHHHFEKGGWSEYRVVLVFSLVQMLFCVVAWFAL